MQIDPSTVLFFGVLIKLLLSVLLLAFWMSDRRAIWFAWYSVGLAFGGTGALILLLRGFEPAFTAIGIAAACLVSAIACVWQGARVFEGRLPLWLPLMGAPALWLAACAVPGFLDSAAWRVVLSSTLIASMLALTAIEYWRGRSERLPSRWLTIVLFSVLALVIGSRLPLLTLAPFPIGALPIEQSWLAGLNLIVFALTITLAVLVVSMTKERLELQQRTRAQTDPLTGALNRRAFMIRGRRLVLRHQTSGDPLCLLFLDLDHFKSLNDRFGHSGGDQVLMKFVSVVHDFIRPGDFLFRLGGEEFCCLLPGTEIELAVSVAQRVRQEFAAYPIILNGTPVKPTVSIGLAATETFGYDPDELLRHADRAAYEAKEQGRNRVIVATSPATVTMAAE